MADEATTAVLRKVKTFLNITWDYEDEQLLDLIEEGKAKITSVCGASTDFTDPAAFALLKEYARLSYNGVRMFFEENFRRELLQLQLDNAVKAKVADA